MASISAALRSSFIGLRLPAFRKALMRASDLLAELLARFNPTSAICGFIVEPGRWSTPASAGGPFLFARKASTITCTSSARRVPRSKVTANSAPAPGSSRVCPTTARRRFSKSRSVFRAVVAKNCLVFAPPSARNPSRAAAVELVSSPRKAFSRATLAPSSFHIPARAAASVKTAPAPVSRKRFNLPGSPAGRCFRRRAASRRPLKALARRDPGAPSSSAIENSISRWFPSPTFATQLITSSS